MRFESGFALLCLGMVLTLSAEAQQPQPSPSPPPPPPTRSFGRIVCPRPVPCPGSSSTPISSAALIAMANSCIAQYFGYSSPSGLFDEAAGVDSDGCLSAIPDVLPKGAGWQLVPACCVIQRSPDDAQNCAMRCEIDSGQ